MSLTPTYERGPVRLYLGDARDVLPHLTDRGVVMFDPPYSKHTHSRHMRGNTMPMGNGKRCVGRSAEFGFSHLTASDRRMFATHASRLASRWVLAFSDERGDWKWRLSMVAAGLEYVRQGFWRKLGGTPQFSGRMPAVPTETIVIAHAREVAKRWNGSGKMGLWDLWWEEIAAESKVQYPDLALWYECAVVNDRNGNTTDARVHTTQKPEKLMVQLCEDFSEPGELILDFTMGSGTTCIGSLRASGGPRRFIGIERDADRFEVARRRIDAELDGVDHRGAIRGQLGMFPSSDVARPKRQRETG